MRLAAALLLLAACAHTHEHVDVGEAKVPLSMLTWNEPFPPFRIVGNVHFVGTSNIGIFLLSTPDGHILIDSGFEANVPALKRSVEALGFRFTDIKILLASHAHIDHVQGHALVRQLTGARVLVSRADAPIVATGGKDEWAYDDAWPPCPVDGVVEDGQQVSLGGTTLVARLTPGHTKGATTWTTEVEEEGRKLAVVFYSSGTIPPGVKLTGNRQYPQAVQDFRKSFAVWRSLACDVPLGAHGGFFGLADKHQRLSAGQTPNPFIDPEGWKKLIAAAERTFEDAAAAGR